MGAALRNMFCVLLVHSPPANPLALFEQFAESLSDDCNYRLEHSFRIQSPTMDQRLSLCCYLLKEKLAEHGKSFDDVGLGPLGVAESYHKMRA